MWSRFYELGTNRPLYFTRDYADLRRTPYLPTHYSFQGEYGIPGLTREVAKRKEGRAEALRRRENKPKTPRRPGRPRRAKRCRNSTERGRWVKDGGGIESERFIEGLTRFRALLRVAPGKVDYHRTTQTARTFRRIHLPSHRDGGQPSSRATVR